MAGVSHTNLCVAGLQVHVYGLDEVLKSGATLVDVVFVLHGRLQKSQDYEEWAQTILAKDAASSSVNRGLLVVLFDQRNHGHRQVSERANLAWADGNETHGQDMYSIQYGTSQDVSFLITFLPAFVFPKGQAQFGNIISAGVSLGGHATYLALSNDERIAAGVVIIGCPDFITLMSQRAGAQRDELLPQSLLNLVARLDPKLEAVGKKDLLILKGDEDPLVPWTASQSFVGRLPANKTELIGYPGVGHAFTDEMRDKSAEWISDWRRRP